MKLMVMVSVGRESTLEDGSGASLEEVRGASLLEIGASELDETCSDEIMADEASIEEDSGLIEDGVISVFAQESIRSKAGKMKRVVFFIFITNFH